MKQTDRLALLDWEKYKEDIAKGYTSRPEHDGSRTGKTPGIS